MDSSECHNRLDVSSKSSQSSNGSSAVPKVVTIEWHMLDKEKFFPLSLTSSFCIRSLLYPLTVVKTKIQVQRHNSIYKGTFDALWKISMTEGIHGLYKGFWVSTFQLFSGLAYITSYESVREMLLRQGVTDSRLRALCGGAAASVVSQSIIVPFDIVSQHMMVIGQKHGRSVLNPLKIEYQRANSRELATRLIRAVYTQSGVLGFYRGYFASLLIYVPNSAMWWTLYHTYQGVLPQLLPTATPALVTQCLSASLGGATTVILTNPLDLLRARLQVHASDNVTLTSTLRHLWKEERWLVFSKGLSARGIQSVVHSSIIIAGYETVKRLSIHGDYQHLVRW
ncbi:solute carrier family 25 member 44 [Hyalella azteca]|uniref:Solute carrier family 25 member 44 n=1 Tax=Hyalella azteca TaxID=294128 RepID=A0A8B7NZ50_HYAAZ|nr:solute carrier family 25 member 44 [Hyalella azteca]